MTGIGYACVSAVPYAAHEFTGPSFRTSCIAGLRTDVIANVHGTYARKAIAVPLAGFTETAFAGLAATSWADIGCASVLSAHVFIRHIGGRHIFLLGVRLSRIGLLAIAYFAWQRIRSGARHAAFAAAPTKPQ